MAQTGTTVRAYISDAVKVNKSLIRILRTANRELRSYESQAGTRSDILISGGTVAINKMMVHNKAPQDR